MRKLLQRCKLPELKKNAAKVIKIQIKYLNKQWRKVNMKIVSIPYQFVKIRSTDDWLTYDDPAEDQA